MHQQQQTVGCGALEKRAVEMQPSVLLESHAPAWEGRRDGDKARPLQRGVQQR